MYWAFWVSFRIGAECFLLSKMCLAAMGLTQSAVEWVAGALSIEVKWSIKLDTCLHLVLSISIEWSYSFAPSILFPLPRCSYLWAVWSRGQIPVGSRFSAPIQTGPGGPPNLLFGWCQVSFLGVKRPGHGIDHHCQLVPRLRKGTGIPVFHLWACMSCSRVDFIITFYMILFCHLCTFMPWCVSISTTSCILYAIVWFHYFSLYNRVI
jgi:hypothetical protein